MIKVRLSQGLGIGTDLGLRLEFLGTFRSGIPEIVTVVGMHGYLSRLSGSGRISTIRQNPTPVGLHVTRRIGLAPITASTSVRQSAVAAVWSAACVEWLANYSNIPSRQVRPFIGLHVPGDKVSRLLYLHLMFVSCKLSHNRQLIRLNLLIEVTVLVTC